MTTARELLARYVSQSEMSNFFIDQMGIFNVKSYGVMPGTTASQTSNIETCIDAAYNAGASFIYFPPGQYFTTALSNSTKVNFLGDNASFSTEGSTYAINDIFAAGISTINSINNPNGNIDITGSSDFLITPSTVSHSINIGLSTNTADFIYSINDDLLPIKNSELDMTYDSSRMQTLAETIGGVTKKLKTYSYTTDYVLSSINTKIYVDNSTVIEKEYNDTVTYTNNKLTKMVRAIV